MADATDDPVADARGLPDSDAVAPLAVFVAVAMIELVAAALASDASANANCILPKALVQ
jgi:hypothetical protein